MIKYIAILPFIIASCFGTPETSFAINVNLPPNPFGEIYSVSSSTFPESAPWFWTGDCQQLWDAEVAGYSMSEGVGMYPFSCEYLGDGDFTVDWSIYTTYNTSYSGTGWRAIWGIYNIDRDNSSFIVEQENIDGWQAFRLLLKDSAWWLLSGSGVVFTIPSISSSNSDNPTIYGFLGTLRVRLDRVWALSYSYDVYVDSFGLNIFNHEWLAINGDIISTWYVWPIWGDYSKVKRWIPSWYSVPSIINSYASFYSKTPQNANLVNIYHQIRAETGTGTDYLPTWFGATSSTSYIDISAGTWSTGSWWIDFSACGTVQIWCYVSIISNYIYNKFFPTINFTGDFNSCSSGSTMNDSVIQKIANIISMVNPYPPPDGTIICSIFWDYTIWYQRLIPEKNFFEVYAPGMYPALENDGRIIYWQTIPDIIVIFSMFSLILYHRKND